MMDYSETIIHVIIACPSGTNDGVPYITYVQGIIYNENIEHSGMMHI